MKYRSEAVNTKQEVLEVIVKHFEDIGKDYSDALMTCDGKILSYQSGKYDAIWELVRKLQIYEEEV